MTISIALCTYNGEFFLTEQLKSISEQTRLPDELVVCDDRSSDRTLQILHEFAASAPFPVRIVLNESNLGSTKNFEKAISLCGGDIIALSDQDDVWLPYKLARTEEEFKKSASTGAVFTNADVVDADLHPLGFSLWESESFGPPIRKAFEKGNPFLLLLRRNIVTGATMAFRSEFRNLVLPISRYWIHDAWIALLICSAAKISFIDEKLILYRQHATNQIGTRMRDNETFLLEVEKAKTWGSEAIFRKAKILSSVHKSGLKGFPLATCELASGHYHRYSKGLKSYLRDLAGKSL